MKASETNARYTGKVRECTNYSVRSIKNIFKDEKEAKKNRQACSHGEKEMQLKLKKDLEEFTDCVEVEEFTAKPDAKKMSYIFGLLFLILSSALIIISGFLKVELLYGSAGFSVFALLATFGIFGFFAKQEQSINIVATRKSTEETTKKVVFVANVDAPFKRKFSQGTESFLKTMTVIGALLQIAYSVLIIINKIYKYPVNIKPQYLDIASYILPVFIIFSLCLIFSIDTKSSTMGIANNLSGSFACCGAMRYLSEFDLKLCNTDVSVVLTGAKNANLAGVKAYIEAHAQDNKNLDAHYICVDTLNGFENFSVKSQSEDGIAFVKKASAQAEVEIKDCTANYIVDNGKAFATANVPYATLTTLPESKPDFYNSELDTLDCLDVKSTEAVIKILLDSAYVLDEA